MYYRHVQIIHCSTYNLHPDPGSSTLLHLYPFTLLPVRLHVLSTLLSLPPSLPLPLCTPLIKMSKHKYENDVSAHPVTLLSFHLLSFPLTHAFYLSHPLPPIHSLSLCSSSFLSPLLISLPPAFLPHTHPQLTQAKE